MGDSIAEFKSIGEANRTKAWAKPSEQPPITSGGIEISISRFVDVVRGVLAFREVFGMFHI